MCSMRNKRWNFIAKVSFLNNKMHFDVMWKYVCRFKHKIFIFIIFNVKNINMDDEKDQKKEKMHRESFAFIQTTKNFYSLQNSLRFADVFCSFILFCCSLMGERVCMRSVVMVRSKHGICSMVPFEFFVVVSFGFL